MLYLLFPSSCPLKYYPYQPRQKLILHQTLHIYRTEKGEGPIIFKIAGVNRKTHFLAWGVDPPKVNRSGRENA